MANARIQSQFQFATATLDSHHCSAYHILGAAHAKKSWLLDAHRTKGCSTIAPTNQDHLPHHRDLCYSELDDEETDDQVCAARQLRLQNGWRGEGRVSLQVHLGVV